MDDPVEHPAQDIKHVFLALVEMQIITLMRFQDMLADIAENPTEEVIRLAGDFVKGQVERDIKLRDGLKH